MIKRKFDKTKTSNTKEGRSKNQEEEIVDLFTLTTHKQLTLEMTNITHTHKLIIKRAKSHKYYCEIAPKPKITYGPFLAQCALPLLLCFTLIKKILTGTFIAITNKKNPSNYFYSFV